MTSKLDIFALKPSLRVSKNSDKLSTPPGLLSTIVVIIMSTIFFINKYTLLDGRLSVSYGQLIKYSHFRGDDGFTFYPGTKDAETNFDFLLAFGVYNATDFKPPKQVERLGEPTVYLYKMTTNADGGIV